VLAVSNTARLRDASAVHLHRAQLPDHHVAMRGGFRVTSPARTVVDVAREHGVDPAVVAGDAALRVGLLDEADLADVLELQHNWPASAAARRAVGLMSAASQSPLETLSRLRMTDAGLPAPVLQQEIGDELGHFLGQVDFYWDEFGVVGEADGALKYDGMPAVVAEKTRQSRLLETGLTVVRWEWSDLHRFDLVASRLRSAFVRGRQPGSGRGWSMLNAPWEVLRIP
jgi:hypothetical protein